MTEAEAVEIITERFIFAWPTASGGVIDVFGGSFGALLGPLYGVVGGGVPYCVEGDSLPAEDAFAMLSILHSPAGGQMTQGEHPRILRTGWIWVKTWTPVGAGVKLRATMADAAREVFERRNLGADVAGYLIVQTGASQEGGTDGRWMIGAVRFAFRYMQQT